MDFYIFTLEFWQNILLGLLVGVSAGVGIYGILWINENFEIKGCLSFLIWAGGSFCIGITFLFYFPLDLIFDRIQYARLHEWQYGAVSTLQQDEPLLYNNFVDLNRLRTKESSIIQNLKEEKSKATSASTKELYDKQIVQANKRLEALQAMRIRINDLAVRMYFISYFEKLEQHTTSKEFQEELLQIKADCETLMKLHTATHE